MESVVEPGWKVPRQLGRLGRIEKTEICDDEFFCESCKSKIFWTPRKSTDRKCLSCNPPSTSAIVAYTNATTLDGPDVANDQQDDSTVPKLCAWRVLTCRPSCPHCHGSWIDERWDDSGLTQTCGTCSKKIEPGTMLEGEYGNKNSMYSLVKRNAEVS